MTRDSKVVKLHQNEAGRNLLPLPLVRLRDKAAVRLQALLNDFFDGADDALFAMSDKSHTNAEQAVYFEAMRELRLQRKGISLSFLQWVARAFNDVGRFDPKGQVGGHLEATDRDSLSLVDDGALEEQVAIENMVTKMRSLYNEQILLLHVRIEHLLPAVKLSLDQSPLGPVVLCQGLGEACADLDIDIRAKLVIFKLFDKLLVNRLAPIYQEANAQLAQEGVLPELRRPPVPAPGRRPQAQQTPSSVPAADYGYIDDQDQSETFAELTELLHGSGRMAGFPIAQGDMTAGGNVSTSHLVSLLSGFQGKLRNPEVRMPTGSNLQKLVGKLIVHQQAGKGQVEQVDADVINLVSMLFDFILEDRQLPEPMKALLARLQIPILKVALLDRSFFNRGGHPARKLLNELAMAAVGWTEKKEGQRDPLKEKIESVVERFISDFDSDLGLIQTLLDDFCHFMDLDRRRRELVEQRLRDAEEGRARSECARETVAEVVAKARSGHQLPEAALPLIDEVWVKVLHWFFLREGEKGEGWQQAVATTELLVWTLDPSPINSGTRAAMLKAVPQVVDAVRNGLKTIAWDPFAADKLIRDLEMVHVDVLQNINLLEEKAAEPEAEVAPQAAIAAPPEQPAVESAETLLDSQPPIREAVEPAAVAIQPSRERVEPEAATETIEQAPAIDQRWIERAESLRVGSWVELQEGEDRRLRCKLAAVIKATGKYIFVNRSGTKVAEYPLADVAQAMAEDRLVMLDDGLIFDRALESVIGNLRTNRRD